MKGMYLSIGRMGYREIFGQVYTVSIKRHNLLQVLAIFREDGRRFQHHRPEPKSVAENRGVAMKSPTSPTPQPRIAQENHLPVAN